MHLFRRTVAWLEIVLGSAAGIALVVTAGGFLWHGRVIGHAAIFVAIGAAMLLPVAAAVLWSALRLRRRPTENLLITQTPLMAGISLILYLIWLDPPTR